MIPDFKTYIKESVWSDIHKRSNGEQIRKEDDINLLDRDGLYDYLTSHYKNTNSFVPIYNSETFDTIKVPFLIQNGSDGVFLSFEENEVSIPYASPYKVKGLFSKLANEFSLKSDAKTGRTWYIISPKDGSEVTNTFFIYVIDFLIDNIPDTFERGVERVVNESVWSDIHKRSNGEKIRKEDDINNLDAPGLKDYIESHYKPLNAYAVITCVTNILIVPIVRERVNYSILYSPKSKLVSKITIADDLFSVVNGLFETLKTNFSIEEHKNSSIIYGITPKDGSEVTNKFFIEVIDFILDNIHDSNYYTKAIKKINKKS